jgi:hypothetical protein
VIGHGRWRRRIALLAAGALAGKERERAVRHAGACAACRAEQAGLERDLEALSSDPLLRAEPPVPVTAMLARVQARLDASPAPRAWWAAGVWTGAAAAAAVLGVLTLRPAPAPPPPDAAASPDLLDRVDRSLTRAHAARYLDEAQDVLVAVAAAGRDCEEPGRDLRAEAERSRELLARRTLLLDLEREDLQAARGLVEDVDQALREVAALPACARPQQVRDLHRHLEERRLLLKIDMVTRELLG